MAVIFVTHDLGVIADLCDRVAVMYAGQIVEEASVDDLFATRSTRTPRACSRRCRRSADARRALASIPGVVPTARRCPTGCRFHPRCPYAIAECIRAHRSSLRGAAGDATPGRALHPRRRALAEGRASDRRCLEARGRA